MFDDLFQMQILENLCFEGIFIIGKTKLLTKFRTHSFGDLGEVSASQFGQVLLCIYI